ncbi:hypothetical protein U0C82_18585 [Fulvimarina sp. 2208YS6-2-32]|uniref:Uncharacterized protein n=1 Tax=Fulvimarina uroteuthidis TaxID=3098149 RepID=A0ABU5I7P7_9HYPH|nr:hypothetical protein [Fulvimarina sp. 2208YS6-2-32]MDY8111132.1 hypothetical protein [Fulvimarina sp. 2208YS6-2-32]
MARLAKLMRDDAKFYLKVDRFLDEISDTEQAAYMLERIERLENAIVEITGNPISKPVAPDAAPAQVGPVWTTGEGRGRRLTSEGEAELQKLVDAGRTDIEIAEALGVRPFTVEHRRKRLSTSS